MSECSSSCCSCSESVLPTADSENSTEKQIVFLIKNMDCPTEEALIRNKLKNISAVKKLEFNLLQHTLRITHTLTSSETLETALTGIGMKGERYPSAATSQLTILYISGMDCPTEEGLIRRKLGSMSEVRNLDFNLLQHKLTVDHLPEGLPQILAALKSLDLEAQVDDKTVAKVGSSHSAANKTNWWPMVISGVAATTAEVVHWLNGGFHWSVAVLALLAIISSGLPTYKKGLIALRNFNLNMNALMAIAVTGAMLIGQWPEAAMVMFLFALAEIIEAKSLDRARNAIRGLMDLTPESATIRQDDGQWIDVPAASVPLDARVRVKPGERIALDGVVVSGSSTINQAPITGESLPVEKGENDPVFAGTINQSGSLEYRVTALAANTTLAKIIHAVEAAQGSRAPTQRFVDRFAQVYTPAVCVTALLMALIPPLFFAADWLVWIYRALVLLVVACPCALVISTPVTVVSGLATAARKGILIKGGVYLERGRKLTALALDKTGTLTSGNPEQTDFINFVGGGALVPSLAVSLASRSDHPVSQALVRAEQQEELQIQEIVDFTAIPGRGVSGEIGDQLYYLGNHRLINELGLLTASLEEQLDKLEQQGKTVVLLATKTEIMGLFAVADTIRETSSQAVEELHRLGVKTMILTGDNPHTANAIAQQVGIDEAYGNQLPEDKLITIESLLAQNHTVGMVGDGINDAPALARADIGFAMGAAGTDTAIETADVALMDDDLRKLPTFIRLSRATSAILTQNIAFALSIKAIFIALTFVGDVTMWMAVFADMGTSLLVVFNGLRLLRK